MSRTTIFLPPYFNLRSTHSFVRQVIDPKGIPVSTEMAFDFSSLRFIDGAGLTVFCNTLGWLSKRGVSLFFQNHNLSSEAIRYLDDCGFFEVYLGARLNKFSFCRSSTLPVRPISHAQSYGWLENSAAPWIASKLHTAPNRLHTVKVCMKEIFNNIDEHSTEETGFVHIQNYPQKDRLNITISDFGAGIPNVIRTKYEGVSDAQAIVLATTDGITTKDDGQFCGHGLDTLVQYVVIRNRGTVAIYSGMGGVHCARQGDSIRKTPWQGTSMFPGTLVDIAFRTDDTLLDDAEEEDLEW